MKLKQVIAPPLENNIYVLGDSKEVVIIDAAGDATSTKQVAEVVGRRKVIAILITHGHFDHTMGKSEFKKHWPESPIYLGKQDLFLWQERYPGTEPDAYVEDGQVFKIGSSQIIALHTPGHTPGSTCYYWQAGDTVFTGDTLFPGGPGATRWEYSNFKQILQSIETKLFSLPPTTKVLPGHGKASTISTEQPNLSAWKNRGW